MSKICVFCGQKPTNKNLEHILPQWLLKYTGRYNSEILGTSAIGRPSGTKITFKNFKFPACEECNSKFAELEAKVKPIIQKIDNSKPLNATEINLLLDWMDKVRVGMWLANMYMNKTIDDMQPHMFINNRTGAKDRMLCIEKFSGQSTGLLVGGAETNLFKHMPCVFQLFINDYIYTSASTDLMLSRRLGFPFTDKINQCDEKYIAVKLQQGKQKTTNPVMKTFEPNENRILIYQPIFKLLLPDCTKLYDNEYVKSHCLDWTNGVGGIFYQRGDRVVKYMGNKDTLLINPKPLDKPVEYFVANTIRLQNDVFEQSMKFDSFPEYVQKSLTHAIAQNDLIAKINSHTK